MMANHQASFEDAITQLLGLQQQANALHAPEPTALQSAMQSMVQLRSLVNKALSAAERDAEKARDELRDAKTAWSGRSAASPSLRREVLALQRLLADSRHRRRTHLRPGEDCRPAMATGIGGLPGHPRRRPARPRGTRAGRHPRLQGTQGSPQHLPGQARPALARQAVDRQGRRQVRRAADRWRGQGRRALSARRTGPAVPGQQRRTTAGRPARRFPATAWSAPAAAWSACACPPATNC